MKRQTINRFYQLLSFLIPTDTTHTSNTKITSNQEIIKHYINISGDEHLIQELGQDDVDSENKLLLFMYEQFILFSHATDGGNDMSVP